MRYIPPILLLLALLCQGCSSDPASPTSQGLPPGDIMELRTGNQWIGRTTAGSSVTFDTLRVIGDTMVGTERWYRTDIFLTSGIVPMLRPDLAYAPYMTNRADGLYGPSS